MSVRTATVLTHRRTEEVREALVALREAAVRAGVTLRFDADETAKHAPEAGENVVLDAPISPDVDLCIVLGGDGTILRALQHYIGTGVPVFAVNYGQVGFLSTLESDRLDEGLERAFAGDFEAMHLPVMCVNAADKTWMAINDVSFHQLPPRGCGSPT